VPQRDELMRYLDGLRQTDEMLRLLVGGLERRGSEAVVACLRRPPAEPCRRLCAFWLERQFQS
jgi:hypothetical protein